MVLDEEDTGQAVLVLAQNPGRGEEVGQRFLGWGSGGTERWEGTSPRPMIGKSGWQLDHEFLPVAGLSREEVRCANVIRCRVGNGDALPPLTETRVRDAITHCQRAYFHMKETTKTIVVLGAYSLWAMTGCVGGEKEDDGEDETRASHGITGWRGWCPPYRPQFPIVCPMIPQLFCTYHPSFYSRAHWLKPIGKMDFHRLGQILSGRWPEPFPSIERHPPVTWPERVACDTEYQPWDGGKLTRMSAAWREENGTPHVYVIEAQDVPEITSCPKTLIFHNAEADWPYMVQCFRRTPESWEDTMYAHALLYGTWQHTLGFLGSLYAKVNRWKHLEGTDPIVYSGMDALATWDVWAALARELAADPLSHTLYTEELKPLLPHLLRRPSIRTHTLRVSQWMQRLSAQQGEARAKGEVAAGWPLNVSSADMVSRWLLAGQEHANT